MENLERIIETITNKLKGEPFAEETLSRIKKATKIVVNSELSKEIEKVDISKFNIQKIPFNSMYIECGNNSINFEKEQDSPYNFICFYDIDDWAIPVIVQEKLPRFYVQCSNCNKETKVNIKGYDDTLCKISKLTDCRISKISTSAIKLLIYVSERFQKSKHTMYKIRKEEKEEKENSITQKYSYDYDYRYVYVEDTKVKYLTKTKTIENRKSPVEHSVKGFLRRYKSGKVVEVKPYKRGMGAPQEKDKIYKIIK